MDIIGSNEISMNLSENRKNNFYRQLFQLYLIIFNLIDCESKLNNEIFIEISEKKNLELKKKSILKFIDVKQYGAAIKLAEKCEEFETIIFICEV